jgi:rare lipoprotein A
MTVSNIKTFALAGHASYNTTWMKQKAPFVAALLLAAMPFACQQPQTRELPEWPERPPPPIPGTSDQAAQGGPIKSPTPSSRSLPASDSSGGLAQRYKSHTALDRQLGDATYYADSLAGNSTASGEPYRPVSFTAAHRSLPFGTIVRVVRTDTGRVTYVKVNDRGPFGSSKRIIDLSRAAAEELQMMRAGVVPVRVEILERPAASASR